MLDQKVIKDFEKKVKKTIEQYKLCSKKDKVIVACSGGKDSTSTLYLLNKFGYKVEGLHLNLLIGKWSERNEEDIKSFCKSEGIKLHIVNLRKEMGASMCFFRSNIQERVKLTNCMICGIIKRWLINKKARELGGTRLATGHNLDDGAETVLMNLFKGNLSLMAGMGPKTGVVRDKKFVLRIKPLYFCLNAEVRKYSELKKFPVVYEPCPCLTDSFRKKIREELKSTEFSTGLGPVVKKPPVTGKILGVQRSRPEPEGRACHRSLTGGGRLLFDKWERENPKVKENIVKTFLKVLPELNREDKKERVNYCKICGEPSRGEICKVCELMRQIK